MRTDESTDTPLADSPPWLNSGYPETRASIGSSPFSHISQPFNLEARGPVADAVKAISDGAQVAPELASQAVLAAVAAIAQQHRNVRTLHAVKPLSLYLLTIAPSGEGKTTADAIARRPIANVQALDIKKGAKDCYRLVRDPTVEGLRLSYQHGQRSQAMLNSEGGTFFGGHIMRAEEQHKSYAALNALWDGDGFSVTRATAGRIEIPDCRLTAHLQVQPHVVAEFLNDNAAIDSGFWPRFLLSKPPPSKPRKARRFDPDNDPAILRFWARSEELLATRMADDLGSLPVIEPTEQAYDSFARFFERMEVCAKDSAHPQSLSDIRAFAVRATEHAFRIAANLAVFDGADRIDDELARCGILIASESLDAWKDALSGTSDVEQSGRRLLVWLKAQRRRRATLSAILQLGPRPRSKDQRDAAVAFLEQQGLVRVTNGAVEAI